MILRCFFLVSWCFFLSFLHARPAGSSYPPRLRKYLYLLESHPHNRQLFVKAIQVHRQVSASPSLLRYYREKSRRYPQKLHYSVILVRLYLHRGEFSSAIRFLLQLRQRYPRRFSVFLPYLARAYQSTRRYKQALQVFQQLLSIQRSPDKQIQTLLAMSELYLKIGRGDQAARAWKKIQTLSPRGEHIRQVLLLCSKYQLLDQAKLFLLYLIQRSASPVQKVRYHYLLADFFWKHNRLEDALDHYEYILAHTVPPHWLRAIALERKREIYLRLGKIQALIRAYQRRLKVAPTYELYQELAKIYLQLQHPQTLSFLQGALKRFPKSKAFFHLLLRYFEQRQSYPQAIQLYQKWLQSHPATSADFLKLGHLYAKSRQFLQAEQVWKQAPGSSLEGQLLAAKLLLSYRQNGRAILILKRLLQAKPSLPVRVRIALYLRRANQSFLAKQAIHPTDAERKAYGILPICWLYQRYQFYEEAAKLLEQAHPKSAKIHYELAKIYSANSSLRAPLRAAEHYLFAWKLSKSSKFRRRCASAILQQIYTPQEAKKILPLLEKTPLVQDFTYWHTKAALLSKANQLSEASSAYQKALQLRPNHLDSLEALAALYGQTNPSKAKELYRKLLQLHPSQREKYLWQLFGIYQQLGEFSQMRGTLRQLQQLPNLSPRSYLRLSQYYQRQGQEHLARQVLQDAFHTYPQHPQILKRLFLLTYPQRPQDAIERYGRALLRSSNPKVSRWIKGKILHHYLQKLQSILNTSPIQLNGAEKLYKQAYALTFPHTDENLPRLLQLESLLLRIYLALPHRDVEISRKVIQKFRLLCKTPAKSGILLRPNTIVNKFYLCQMLAKRLNSYERKQLRSLLQSLLPSIARVRPVSPPSPRPLYLPGPLLWRQGTGSQAFIAAKLYGDHILFLDKQALKCIRLPSSRPRTILSMSLTYKHFKNILRLHSHSSLHYPFFRLLPVVWKGRLYLPGRSLRYLSSLHSASSPKNILLPLSSHSFYLPYLVRSDILLVLELEKKVLFAFQLPSHRLIWKLEVSSFLDRLFQPNGSSFFAFPLPKILASSRTLILYHIGKITSLQLRTGALNWTLRLPKSRVIPYAKIALFFPFLALEGKSFLWVLHAQTGQKLCQLPVANSNFLYPYFQSSLGITSQYLVYYHSMQTSFRSPSRFSVQVWRLPTFQRAWAKELWIQHPLSYSSSLFQRQRNFLTLWGSYLYLHHDYLRVFQLSDGKLLGEDRIRKWALERNLLLSLNIRSPMFWKGQLLYFDLYGNLFCHQGQKPFPTFQSRGGKRFLTLAQPDPKICLSPYGFSLRFYPYSGKDRGRLAAQLAKLGSLDRLLGDLEWVCRRQNLAFPPILLVFSPKVQKTYATFQPYAMGGKTILGFHRFRYRQGIVVYLNSDSKRLLLRGEVWPSRLISRLVEGFLYFAYGVFNSTKLPLSSFLGRLEGGTSSFWRSAVFTSLVRSIGAYGEFSYAFSGPEKRYLRQLLRGNPYYFTKVRLRYRVSYQVAALLALEGALSSSHYRRSLFSLLLVHRPFDMLRLLRYFLAEFPQKRKEIRVSLQKAFGGQYREADMSDFRLFFSSIDLTFHRWGFRLRHSSLGGFWERWRRRRFLKRFQVLMSLPPRELKRRIGRVQSLLP